MIKVLFYGIARIKLNTKSVEIDASNINELLDKLSKMFNLKVNDFKNNLIYVNDVNINDLSIYKTILKDGDVVMFLSPSSGG